MRNRIIPSPRSAVSFSTFNKNTNIKLSNTPAERLSLYTNPRYKPNIALPVTNNKEPWYTGAAGIALQFLLLQYSPPPPKN
jgi:hypothetical protein